MIKLDRVYAGIGKIEILTDITLEAAAGRLVTVIGANGAGKTTLLRVISNLLPPRRGTILFEEQSTEGVAPHELARDGLVHVPQGRQIIPNLNVEQNLLIGARRVPTMTSDALTEGLEREYARFPVLRMRAGVAGGSLSGGEQQMLAVSRALMMRPKVLMLDEPSLGLAPQVVTSILGALRRLVEEGMTVILVEQMALNALSIADEGYVLKNGRIALSGPAASLAHDKAVLESYLG